MIIEFDTKGDILSRFPAVYVDFSVKIENTSDGAGEFMRDLVEFEVSIDNIDIIETCEGNTIMDDVGDEMKTWFVEDEGKRKSFYDIIQERCEHHVSENLESYNE